MAAQLGFGVHRPGGRAQPAPGAALAWQLPAVGMAPWAVAAPATVVGRLARESPRGDVQGKTALQILPWQTMGAPAGAYTLTTGCERPPPSSGSAVRGLICWEGELYRSLSTHQPRGWLQQHHGFLAFPAARLDCSWDGTSPGTAVPLCGGDTSLVQAPATLTSTNLPIRACQHSASQAEKPAWH